MILSDTLDEYYMHLLYCVQTSAFLEKISKVKINKMFIVNQPVLDFAVFKAFLFLSSDFHFKVHGKPISPQPLFEGNGQIKMHDHQNSSFFHSYLLLSLLECRAGTPSDIISSCIVLYPHSLQMEEKHTQ